MTTYFIKRFKAGIFCRKCKGPGVPERKMCNAHRAQARDHWRTWVPRRRAECKCIACNRKPFNDGQRCRKCTLQNRSKCKRWMAVPANAEHCSVYGLKRKAECKKAGVCNVCAARRPIHETSTVKCLSCLVFDRKRNRLRKHRR